MGIGGNKMHRLARAKRILALAVPLGCNIASIRPTISIRFLTMTGLLD